MTQYEIENLPQSTAGKRMLARVSPVYDKSAFMKNFYEVVGKEFDKIHAYFETLREQNFTTQVTWGIKYLEHKYSIIPDESLTLEQRRERLKIRLSHKYPLNPAVLEKYALDNFDLETYLGESDAGYIDVYLETFKKREYEFIKWLLIERPAHLQLKCKVSPQIAESNINIGMADFIRGKVKVNYLPPPDGATVKICAGIMTFIRGTIRVGIAADDHAATVIPYCGMASFIGGFIRVGKAGD